MKVSSWQHYGLDARKMLLFGGIAGGSGGLAVYFLTVGILGSSAPELGIVIAAITCYLGLSFPKRLLEAEAYSQSKESPVLAVMGSANIEATRSLTRSFLYLRSSEPGISTVLKAARARILLGRPPASALEEVGDRLASYSARDVLRSVAAARLGAIVERGEESQGITNSSQLAEESKLPLFTAVAFFAPIMLLLFLIFSHQSDPASLGETVALEVVLLDVAFYFSSTERRRLG
ncbi:MAG: hypothetical protein LYZ69_02990 [Nitrososphaerales archaeon]|nr:hypothetical protein [Nitrososphaerales archaeon]